MATGSVWVGWPLKGTAIALVMLIGSRKHLFKNNLFDTVDKWDSVSCTAESREARTITGICNNLKNPKEGAAGVRFGRNVPLPTVKKAFEIDIMDPPPELISKKLMTREKFIPTKMLNLLTTTWIQFMTHDWFSHGARENSRPHKLKNGKTIKRTKIDRTHSSSSKVFKASVNVNTHWWDGSQIYGSSLKEHKRVRVANADGTNAKCELKLAKDGWLPLDKSGLEVTGFVDNWWVGLAMLHNIFTREHNYLCEKLRVWYPKKYDEHQLYNKARLINAALMAKIHTIEWTPAILQNKVLNIAMHANWFGLLGKRMHKAIHFGPAALSGLVGGKTKNGGVAYTLTEEFVAVYRMHPLLPETVDVYDFESKALKTKIPLLKTRRHNVSSIVKKHNLDNLWYSFGAKMHPGALSLRNFPKALQNINIPGDGKVDLAAIDVFRDRERGIPRYNEFRRLINLKPITKFEDLTTNKRDLADLKEVYGNDIEKIDLLIGCLAETIRPSGFGFGETAFQIFIAMASRRLLTDRFYTVDFTKKIYTKEGMNHLDNNTMVDVIVRHFPKLAGALKGQTNAFTPWGNKKYPKFQTPRQFK